MHIKIIFYKIYIKKIILTLLEDTSKRGLELLVGIEFWILLFDKQRDQSELNFV